MSFEPVELLHVSIRFSPGQETAVGRLARLGHRILFEFDPAFLAAPLPLSPLQLPPRSGVHEERSRTFEGLFGVFDDSLPDGWGRLLMDREMDRLGIGRERLTPLDRLAYVGEDGAGALIYRPSRTQGPSPPEVDLSALAADARKVLEGDEDTVFPELLALGGSSGGARPKVLVCWHPATGRIGVGDGVPEEEFVPLLVKFASREDPPDVGAVELAYAEMARSAGVEMAPTWLLGARDDHPGFFATNRFDRPPGGGRLHLHSLCGLLHADHRVPSTDYETLLKVTRLLTRDQRAVEQAFRRMVFNVLAHNRDDHSRNFAFLMDASATWRLAPAYDLTFSHGPGGEHWMALAGEGRDPGSQHLLAVAAEVGVAERTARTIVDEVAASVSRWDGFASTAGVTRTSRRKIGGILTAHLGGDR